MNQAIQIPSDQGPNKHTDTQTQTNQISAFKNDRALFEALTTRPHIAWPTIILFLVAFPSYFISTWFAVNGELNTLVAIAINSVTAFWCFTVLHEAGHNSLSLNKRLNDTLGRLAAIPLTMMPILKSWRFMHSQHHRFANEPEDPDLYSHGGPKYLYPLRWFTLDYGLGAFYGPLEKNRPEAERKENKYGLIFLIAVIATAIISGYGLELLLYFYIPSRFAVMFLALAFDFLPHYPHDTEQRDDIYKATNNRVGWEWLLTPVLLYQNYHLVHHLYPLVPFYRYLKVWRALEQDHMSHEPNLLDIFNRPVTINK